MMLRLRIWLCWCQCAIHRDAQARSIQRIDELDRERLKLVELISLTEGRKKIAERQADAWRELAIELERIEHLRKGSRL